MGMSPNEVARTTLGKFAAARKGFDDFNKGEGGEAEVMSDEAFEAYMVEKATNKPTAQAPEEMSSLADLMGKMKTVK